MSEQQQAQPQYRKAPPRLDDAGDDRMSRARIFIGSSSSGKEVARAIQYHLDDVADADVWDEGVFGVGMGNLESLVQALDVFDFAVLVLTPDDLLVRGGEESNTPRDNVLLELGLFIGRLGRSRTFAVCQRDRALRMPSDLAGVTLADFAKPDDPERLRAALGPACYRIRNAVRAQQRRTAVQELQTDLHTQQNQIARQQEQITYQQNIINQLVVFSMAGYMYGHLRHVFFAQRNKSPLKYDSVDDHLRRELIFLADN